MLFTCRTIYRGWHGPERRRLKTTSLKIALTRSRTSTELKFNRVAGSLSADIHENLHEDSARATPTPATMDLRIQTLFAIADKLCSLYSLDVAIVLHNPRDNSSGSSIFRSSKAIGAGCPHVRSKPYASLLTTANHKSFHILSRRKWTRLRTGSRPKLHPERQRRDI